MRPPEDENRSVNDRIERKRSEPPLADDRPTAPGVVPEVFPPTLREVMLRPWWIGMLVLCLVVAGVFAWLGQWQLGRALQTSPTPPGATEEVQPIADVTQPGEYLPDPLVGQKVAVSGWWVGEDFVVVESRFNDGVEGYWVTGQLRLADGEAGPDQLGPVSLSVALGWAPTRDAADAAASALETLVADSSGDPIELTGRLDRRRGSGASTAGSGARHVDHDVVGSAARTLARRRAALGLPSVPGVGRAARPASPRSRRRLPPEGPASTGSTSSTRSNGPSSRASRSTSGTGSRATPGRKRSRTSRTPPPRHHRPPTDTRPPAPAPRPGSRARPGGRTPGVGAYPGSRRNGRVRARRGFRRKGRRDAAGMPQPLG